MKGKNIYMIAISGIGMGSLAGYLKEAGANVSGSDDNIYPPMSTLLEKLKISVKKGFSRGNIPVNSDYIIVGNAVGKTNPEAIEMAGLKIPYYSLPGFLEKFVLPGKRSLVVAGTHGKTTTTSLLGWCLESAKVDPSVLVGGVVRGWEKSYRHGKGDYYVLEGDEYDTAFFDKVPKFLHYLPHDLILTGIEFDHADIYSNLDAIKVEFGRLVSITPKDGSIIAYGENEALRDVLAKTGRKCKTYGFTSNFDYYAGDISFSRKLTKFKIIKNKEMFLDVDSPLMGKQNILNSIAVVGLMDCLGIMKDAIKKGLETFPGVKRRQEIIAETGGMTVIEDFAHHPTAIRLTIEGVRLSYPKSKIWALFEPRTNTSRRKFFQDELPKSFNDADKIIIARVFNADKLAQEEALNVENIIEKMKLAGKDAYYIPEVNDIVREIAANIKKEDVVLIMSNGAFGGIYEKMIKALKGK